MKCANCKKDGATETIWSPTWISANEGPCVYCPTCARTFDPVFNPRAKGGEFIRGMAAYNEFERLTIINRARGDLYNAIKCEFSKGKIIGGSPGYGPFAKATYVLDGNAVLITSGNCVFLGTESHARENFPNLCRLE